MNRRALLGGGAAAVMLPALLAGLRRLGYPEPGPSALAALRPLVAALPLEAAGIGDALWEGQSWARDRVDVAADLLAGWDGTDLAAWLVARKAADHAADRVRPLQGWRLSLTEARLLMLAATGI